MKIKEKLRNIYLWYLRRLFKNAPELSVISNNCLGGMVLHDRGLRFNSPTVNLWIPAHDYVRMLQKTEMMYEILTNANGGGYIQ